MPNKDNDDSAKKAPAKKAHAKKVHPKRAHPSAREQSPRSPWQQKARFSPDGSYAYRPGVLLIRSEDVDKVRKALRDNETQRFGIDAEAEWEQHGGWVGVTGDFSAPKLLEYLRKRGVKSAQVDHVFFASALRPSPLYGSPLYGSPLYGSPLYGSPLYGSPLYGSPLYGSPLYGSPLYGSPLYGSPFAIPELRETGVLRSSATPAFGRTIPENDPLVEPVRVAVLDTGLANKWKDGAALRVDHNDELEVADPDGRRFLAPYAGHGTFILGIIEQLAPGCSLTSRKVVDPDGAVSETGVRDALERLHRQFDALGNPTGDRPTAEIPHLVCLAIAGHLESLARYEDPNDPPRMLSEAIRDLSAKGTVIVASAGNEASWVPTYPADFEGVISVGALDGRGYPAPFTNYGPWVRAGAVGTDVVSWFFDFDDDEREFYGVDLHRFSGWARWSGTSFAAPRVVAALARWMSDAVRDLIWGTLDDAFTDRVVNGVVNGKVSADAVEAVLGPADAKQRYPMLGTIVIN